jgi:Fructose-1,6-bisphosphatase
MKFLLALISISSVSAFAPAASFKTTSIAASSVTNTQLYGEYGASSTSFYTTTEKQDSYASLDDVLNEKCKDEKTRAVIKDMLDACADITEALRTALVTVEGSANTFGDAQLSVDVIADNLMWEACKNSPVIREGASEEDPEVRNTDEQGDGEFTVCWDPLDGSSIVDNNWAVGTMIGIWPKSTGLIGATGRDQVTSLVATLWTPLPPSLSRLMTDL